MLVAVRASLLAAFSHAIGGYVFID